MSAHRNLRAHMEPAESMTILPEPIQPFGLAALCATWATLAAAVAVVVWVLWP